MNGENDDMKPKAYRCTVVKCSTKKISTALSLVIKAKTRSETIRLSYFPGRCTFNSSMINRPIEGEPTNSICSVLKRLVTPRFTRHWDVNW